MEYGRSIDPYFFLYVQFIQSMSALVHSNCDLRMWTARVFDFSRSLRVFGCKVAIVEPGAFRTPIMNAENIRRCVDQGWSHASDESKEQFGEDYYNFCE